MAHDEHHEHLIDEIAEIFEPIFSNSPQAIYIYLDDAHKICNQNYSDLLGFDSIEEWVNKENSLGNIIGEDHSSVVDAYERASENMEASFLSITLITKGGSEIEADLIIAPFSYKGEVLAVHFINPRI